MPAPEKRHGGWRAQREAAGANCSRRDACVQFEPPEAAPPPGQRIGGFCQLVRAVRPSVSWFWVLSAFGIFDETADEFREELGLVHDQMCGNRILVLHLRVLEWRIPLTWRRQSRSRWAYRSVAVLHDHGTPERECGGQQTPLPRTVD